MGTLSKSGYKTRYLAFKRTIVIKSPGTQTSDLVRRTSTVLFVCNSIGSVEKCETALLRCSYWYFKQPTFQATTLEEAAVLLDKSLLTETTIFGDSERSHIIEASQCKMHEQVKGLDGMVLWHHYSWVRSRDRLEHKLRHWAHADDIYSGVDASNIIDTIFRDDNVNDIVHQYEYVTVNNTFHTQV